MLTVPAAPSMVPIHLKRLSDSGKAEMPLSPDIYGDSVSGQPGTPGSALGPRPGPPLTMSAISSCCSLREKDTLPAGPAGQPRPPRPRLTSFRQRRGPPWLPPQPLCGRQRWARRRGQRSARPWRLRDTGLRSGRRCPAGRGRWAPLPLPSCAAPAFTPSRPRRRSAQDPDPAAAASVPEALQSVQGAPGAGSGDSSQGSEFSGATIRARGAPHSRPVPPAPALRLNVSNVRPLLQSARSPIRASQSPLGEDAAAAVTAGGRRLAAGRRRGNVAIGPAIWPLKGP